MYQLQNNQVNDEKSVIRSNIQNIATKIWERKVTLSTKIKAFFLLLIVIGLSSSLVLINLNQDVRQQASTSPYFFLDGNEDLSTEPVNEPNQGNCTPDQAWFQGYGCRSTIPDNNPFANCYGGFCTTSRGSTTTLNNGTVILDENGQFNTTYLPSTFVLNESGNYEEGVEEIINDLSAFNQTGTCDFGICSIGGYAVPQETLVQRGQENQQESQSTITKANEIVVLNSLRANNLLPTGNDIQKTQELINEGLLSNITISSNSQVLITISDTNGNIKQQPLPYSMSGTVLNGQETYREYRFKIYQLIYGALTDIAIKKDGLCNDSTLSDGESCLRPSTYLGTPILLPTIVGNTCHQYEGSGYVGTGTCSVINSSQIVKCSQNKGWLYADISDCDPTKKITQSCQLGYFFSDISLSCEPILPLEVKIRNENVLLPVTIGNDCQRSDGHMVGIGSCDFRNGFISYCSENLVGAKWKNSAGLYCLGDTFSYESVSTSDAVVIDFPYYSQRASFLPSNVQPTLKEKFDKTGCGPTSLAMVLCGYKGLCLDYQELEQLYTGEWSESGTYLSTSASILRSYNINSETIYTSQVSEINSNELVELIKSSIEENNVVWVIGEYCYGNGENCILHHAIVVGVTEDNKLIVNDPFAPQNGPVIWGVNCFGTQCYSQAGNINVLEAVRLYRPE